jgi:Fur family transcriptional regulator, peroxide stress response regulator
VFNEAEFRSLCAEHGLAVTHQRHVLYQMMQTMKGHPSPEEIYEQMRHQIPSISLATVYKNIRLFLDSGILRELSWHHGSLRVEMNRHAHHHLVCTRCKTIADIGDEDLHLLRLPKQLPDGFLVDRCMIDILGLCANCQKCMSRPLSN